MCDFCELIDTGISGEQSNFSFNPLLRIEDGSQVFRLWFNRYIYERAGIHTSKLILDYDINISGNYNSVKEVEININYCPFCGEKL